MFYLFLYLIIILTHVFTGSSTECLIGNYCNGNNNIKIPCSMNGNCFVDIFEYFNVKQNKTSFCNCNHGYTTVDDPKGIHCCYEQKKQTIAFLLEFCLSFGAGHYYIGDIPGGVVKSLIEILLIVIICCSYCFIFNSPQNTIKPTNTSSNPVNEDKAHKDDNVRKEKVSMRVIIICLSIMIIGSAIDLLLFGLNILHDGKGVKLRPW